MFKVIEGLLRVVMRSSPRIKETLVLLPGSLHFCRVKVAIRWGLETVIRIVLTEARNDFCIIR